MLSFSPKGVNTCYLHVCIFVGEANEGKNSQQQSSTVKIDNFIFLAILNSGEIKFTAAMCKWSQKYILSQNPGMQHSFAIVKLTVPNIWSK